MKKSKQVPEFKSIEEMAEFWDTHSSADYPDFWEPVTNIRFSKNLKSVYLDDTGSIRKKILPVSLDEQTLSGIKKIAKEKGIGTSTATRMLIRERLSELKVI